MTPRSHRSPLLPLALLGLMLALVSPSTAARADDPIGQVVQGNGPDAAWQYRHDPPLAQSCVDGAICIGAHYPPLAAADTISVTGYTSRGTAQGVTLTITEPRSGRIIYSASTASTPMVGDDAGHSAFRFAVPSTRGDGIGGYGEYVIVRTETRTYTVDHRGWVVPSVSASNEVRVWSLAATY